MAEFHHVLGERLLLTLRGGGHLPVRSLAFLSCSAIASVRLISMPWTTLPSTRSANSRTADTSPDSTVFRKPSTMLRMRLGFCTSARVSASRKGLPLVAFLFPGCPPRTAIRLGFQNFDQIM